ncbi:uncharacterized protein LOC134766115 [Penaeus indicus]|uniref:uncharacterized protein LOC134766115 n=1 Tax=Penaeus indicus TaxID=29960 RepID=UPI00300C2B02
MIEDCVNGLVLVCFGCCTQNNIEEEDANSHVNQYRTCRRSVVFVIEHAVARYMYGISLEKVHTSAPSSTKETHLGKLSVRVLQAVLTASSGERVHVSLTILYINKSFLLMSGSVLSHPAPDLWTLKLPKTVSRHIIFKRRPPLGSLDEDWGTPIEDDIDFQKPPPPPPPHPSVSSSITGSEVSQDYAGNAEPLKHPSDIYKEKATGNRSIKAYPHAPHPAPRPHPCTSSLPLPLGPSPATRPHPCPSASPLPLGPSPASPLPLGPSPATRPHPCPSASPFPLGPSPASPLPLPSPASPLPLGPSPATRPHPCPSASPLPLGPSPDSRPHPCPSALINRVVVVFVNSDTNHLFVSDKQEFRILKKGG